MSIVLPAVFAFAALYAVAAMWRAVQANLGALRDLHRQATMPGYGSDITVTLREPLADFDPMASVRRPRQLRHPVPKPITHRLHHFAKNREAA